MIRRILATALLLLAAAGMSAQNTIPFDFELGYRWTDIEGNEDVYRTQINEEEGLLLRAFRLSSADFAEGSFLDHVRIDASELGVGPAGALSVQAGKEGLWDFRLGYRQADAFNYHPGFALGQHRVDRQRTNLDLDLQFLPGRKFSPFIGYATGSYDGPGTTTYTLGQDDFQLDSDLDETEQEIRAGFIFNTGKVFGSVTQGWRSLESEETMLLSPGAGAGNNPGSVLGRPIEAGGITRNSNFDVDTPFTNAFFTAEFIPRLRLIGNYSQFAAEGEGPEVESATGSFTSFALRRFFGGLDETVNSRAENNTWRGGLRGEFAVTDTLDVFGAWRTEHREMDGVGLFNSIFTNTVNFSGADPLATLEEVYEAESALDRDENVFEVGVAARQLGPFSLRASYRNTSQEVELSPDVEEIVVAGPEQGGSYDRQIDTFEAVGGFGIGNFTSSVTMRLDRADDAVLRTDYRDRDRLRLRAAYTFPRFVRVGAMAEQIDHENREAGTGYDARTRQYGTDLEVSLTDKFRLRGAYSRFDTDSEALIRRPENFVIEEWTYAETGDSLEAGFSLLLAPVSLDADFIRFENEGDNPLNLDRYRARLMWDFMARAGLGAEWSSDEYEESLFPVAAYKATRYGVFFRWRQ
jgi:hypothetical protein